MRCASSGVLTPPFPMIGNVERLLHFSELFPVGIAAMEVFGEPGVDGDHVRPALLDYLGDFQMIGGIVIEADAGLDRNRQRNRLLSPFR